jgi:hypothetical protein
MQAQEDSHADWKPDVGMEAEVGVAAEGVEVVEVMEVAAAAVVAAESD